MKRSILMSLLVIGAAVTLIGAASLAWFSDSETSKGNVLTSDSLDLTVNGENDPDTPTVVTLGNMFPSENYWSDNITLKNVGSSNGHADIHYGEIVNSDVACTEPEAEASGAGCPVPPNLSDKVQVDICHDVDANGQCDAGEPHAVLGDLTGIASKCYELGPLAANGEMKLMLSFHIHSDAGNEYQADKVAFEIRFTLHQPNSPHPNGDAFGAELPCPAIP